MCPRSGRWLQPGTVIDVAEHQLPKYYLFCSQVPDDTPATSWAGGVVQAVSRFIRPNYKCTVCGQGFQSPEALQIHLGSQKDRPHREHGLEIARLDIYSPGDGTEFALKNGKPAIKRPNDPEEAPTFSCPWCASGPFKTTEGLARHLMRAHAERYPDLPADDLAAWTTHVETRKEAQGRLV